MKVVEPVEIKCLFPCYFSLLILTCKHVEIGRNNIFSFEEGISVLKVNVSSHRLKVRWLTSQIRFEAPISYSEALNCKFTGISRMYVYQRIVPD